MSMGKIIFCSFSLYTVAFAAGLNGCALISNMNVLLPEGAETKRSLAVPVSCTKDVRIKKNLHDCQKELQPLAGIVGQLGIDKIEASLRAEKIELKDQAMAKSLSEDLKESCFKIESAGALAKCFFLGGRVLGHFGLEKEAEDLAVAGTRVLNGETYQDEDARFMLLPNVDLGVWEQSTMKAEINKLR